jgi:HK97 gp10 family phage protein
MELRFDGGAELVRALRELPKAVRENVLEAAVVAGGAILRDATAAKAPRHDPRRRPGTVRLADSFKITVTEQSHAFVTVNVGTRVPYAHLLEYGHQIVPRGPNRRRVSITTVSKTGRVSTRFGVDPTARQQRVTAAATGFVAPRPFMRPAFDENKEAMLRKIGEVLGVGIEAEAARLASPSQARSWVAGGGLTGVV